MNGYRLDAQSPDLLVKPKSKDLNGKIDERNQQMWVRAMEQQQMQNWFGLGLLDRQTSHIQEPGKTEKLQNLKPTMSLAINRNTQLGQDHSTPDLSRKLDFSLSPVAASLTESPTFYLPKTERDDSLPEQIVMPKAMALRSEASAALVTKRENLTSAILQDAGFQQETIHATEYIAPAQSRVVHHEKALSQTEVVPPLMDTEDTELNISPKQVNLGLGGFLSQLLNRSLSPQLSVTDENELVHHRIQFGYLSKFEKLANVSELESMESKPVPADQQAFVSKQNQQEALRLHSEWSEHGVRIWLGIDQSVQMDASQIAIHIAQWLGSQKINLLALVCNGKTIHFQRNDLASSNAELETEVMQDLSSVVNSYTVDHSKSAKSFISSKLGPHDAN